MYLVFDTETSDLPKFDLPFDDPSQGRMVQLGMLLLDKDYKEKATFSSLIKPTGWTMNPKAQERHGIPIELCHEYGLVIEDVLDIFDRFIQKADLVICFGLKFDTTIIDIEQTNKKRGVPFRYDWNKQGFCVMQKATPICGLKQPNGKGKWPKLQEAYKHFYGKEFEKAHDALADCRATSMVFQALKLHGVK